MPIAVFVLHVLITADWKQKEKWMLMATLLTGLNRVEGFFLVREPARLFSKFEVFL